MLLADDGVTYRLIAEQLEIEANVVTTWVIRWQQTGSGQDLSVEKRLADAPRSGAPDTFTPEQLCRMVALACELPSVSGRPITHWTPRELRDEVLKQGIVDTISERHTGRVLATRELRPHKRQYWLTGKPDEEKDEKIQVIRQLYEEAPRQAEEGVLTMSIDEKTGIQALERESPHTPMKPGLDEKSRIIMTDTERKPCWPGSMWRPGRCWGNVAIPARKRILSRLSRLFGRRILTRSNRSLSSIISTPTSRNRWCGMWLN